VSRGCDSAKSRGRTNEAEIAGANGECGPLSNLNFGKVLEAHPNSRTADDVLRGFQDAQAYLWQGEVSLEHELRKRAISNQLYELPWHGQNRWPP